MPHFGARRTRTRIGEQSQGVGSGVGSGPVTFQSALRRQGQGEDLSDITRDVTARLPFSLGAQFGGIAEQGIFSDEDIQNIFGQRRRAGAAARSRLGRGLRSSLGRRLGSRSGAVNTLIANRVFAPSMIAEQRDLGNLLERNVESRGQGRAGLMAILQFLEQRRQSQLDRDAQGGTGVLDFLGPILDIASVVPWPGQPIAAGVNAARRAPDLFQSSGFNQGIQRAGR